MMGSVLHDNSSVEVLLEFGKDGGEECIFKFVSDFVIVVLFL